MANSFFTKNETRRSELKSLCVGWWNDCRHPVFISLVLNCNKRRVPSHTHVSIAFYKFDFHLNFFFQMWIDLRDDFVNKYPLNHERYAHNMKEHRAKICIQLSHHHHYARNRMVMCCAVRMCVRCTSTFILDCRWWYNGMRSTILPMQNPFMEQWFQNLLHKSDMVQKIACTPMHWFITTAHHIQLR